MNNHLTLICLLHFVFIFTKKSSIFFMKIFFNKMTEKLEQIRTNLQKLHGVLEEAKTDFFVDKELFLNSTIFKMGRFIRLYHELMKDLEIELDIDMEEALEDLDPTRSLIEDLKTIKMEWDSFLKSLDENVDDL